MSNIVLGRTARIGHDGDAWSFYTERDEPIAEILTKTLLETNQEIPDFLQQYVPDGVKVEDLKFEPGSDEEDEGGDGAGDAGGWGGEPGGHDDKAAATGDAGGWGGGDDNKANATGDNASGWGGGASSDGGFWGAGGNNSGSAAW